MLQKEFNYKKAKEFVLLIGNIKVNGVPFHKILVLKQYYIFNIVSEILFVDAKKRTNEQIKKYTIKNWLLDVVKHVPIFIFGSFSVFVLFSKFRRTPNLLFSVDKVSSKYHSDVRINSLYTYFQESNKKFVEIFHTLPSKMIRNFLIRRRFSFYLETFDVFYYALFPFLRLYLKGTLYTKIGTDSHFIRMKIIDSYCYIYKLKYRYYFLKIIFFVFKFKNVYGIDDNRNLHSLALICKEKKMNFRVTQHGHFTTYHVGSLNLFNMDKNNILKPDFIYVWSEYWKRELFRLNGNYEMNSIKIATPNELISETIIHPNFIKSNSKSILIPYETDAPKKEIIKYLDRFCELGFHIYFKARSDIELKIQKEQYELDNYKGEISIVFDEQDILSNIDFVIGVYSSILYKYIGILIPVGYLETSMDYGYGMVENDLVELLKIDSLKQDIIPLLHPNMHKLRERQKKLLQGSESYSLL